MRNQKDVIMVVLILVLLGGTIFLYNKVILPKAVRSAEQRVRTEVDDQAMPKVKAAVVKDEGGIAKYTLITEELIAQKIIWVDVPVKYAAQKTVPDVGMLKGKITTEDLHPGEQINLDSLSTERKWFGEYERLKEFTVASIVAGEVKTGNIVDMVVSYDSGDYDVVVPKIKIKKLVEEHPENTTGEVPKADGKTAAQNSKPAAVTTRQADGKNAGLYTLVLAVDEEQYRDLELAAKLGRFVTRLYIDESQPPSKKTFDYQRALSRLNVQNPSIKIKNAEEIKRDQEEFNKAGAQKVNSTGGQLPAIKPGT